MNAVTHPRREDYEPTVRAFLPSAEGEELSLRASLLLMRDRAMSTKSHCGEEAWTVLDHVERMASRYAFTGMPLDDLRELRRLMITLVAASSGLEALFAPELPLGGTDGRG